MTSIGGGVENLVCNAGLDCGGKRWVWPNAEEDSRGRYRGPLRKSIPRVLRWDDRLGHDGLVHVNADMEQIQLRGDIPLTYSFDSAAPTSRFPGYHELGTLKPYRSDPPDAAPIVQRGIRAAPQWRGMRMATSYD